MKKILTMVTAIMFTATLPAVASGNQNNENKQVLYEMSFSKLFVQDGIEVILVESNSKKIEFSGNDADKVDWKITNGQMVISSKKGTLKGKVKLLVNVSNLNEIFVKDGSVVSSQGRLNSNSLKIYLEGDAGISIKSAGTIWVIKVGETDLDIMTATKWVFFG